MEELVEKLGNFKIKKQSQSLSYINGMEKDMKDKNVLLELFIFLDLNNFKKFELEDMEYIFDRIDIWLEMNDIDWEYSDSYNAYERIYNDYIKYLDEKYQISQNPHRILTYKIKRYEKDRKISRRNIIPQHND